ncbi:MAG: peptidase C39 family protein [bacterium]
MYTDTRCPYDEKSALCSPVFKDRRRVPECVPQAKTLVVRRHSQMTEHAEYARDICSPTALSMVLDYWGIKSTPLETARGVFDAGKNIYGNWFFNTAFAGLKGLDAHVARMNSAADAEGEIAAGRPLIASITHGPGELKNSPIKETKGHLVVIKGFDRKGNFIVNDPAACDCKSVERIYERREFCRAWLKNRYGTAYRIQPRFPGEIPGDCNTWRSRNAKTRLEKGTL